MRVTRRSALLLVIPVLASLVLTAPPAFATVNCDDVSGPFFNYAITASPSTSFQADKGVRGFATVKQINSLHTYGGAHIESLYLFHVDVANFLEFGYKINKINLVTEGPYVFDRLAVDGSSGERTDQSIVVGDYKWTIVYNSTSGRFDFKINGAAQNFHRSPTWSAGRSVSVGEIGAQCDIATTRWWNLARTADGSSWSSWTGIHWNCDTETDNGYQGISATEWHVYNAPDEFTGCPGPFA
jgi:hypothetical protein